MTRCEFDGCEREAVAVGYCASHYKQFLRHGRKRLRLTPLRLETLVKLPGIHIKPATAAKLRRVHRNLYKAAQQVLDGWGEKA